MDFTDPIDQPCDPTLIAGARPLLDQTVDIGHEHVYSGVLEQLAFMRRWNPDDAPTLHRLARAISECLPDYLLRAGRDAELQVPYMDDLHDTVQVYLASVAFDFTSGIDNLIAQCIDSLAPAAEPLLRQACQSIAARIFQTPARLENDI